MIYLVVHAVSYRFITAVTHYIHDQLMRHAQERRVKMIVCNDIDDVAAEDGSIIFVIGDPFGAFTRRPTCSYVFINFSLLYCLGDESRYDSAGRGWVAGKHAKFAEKAHRYDLILDFRADQTSLLTREFGIPVSTFTIGLQDTLLDRNLPRKYDVCFVGSPTPRRAVLTEELSKSGLLVSPSTGVLEDIAVQSKLMLNVHAFGTDNIEIPRAVAAFLSGAVLVTERASQMASYFPEALYLSADYDELTQVVRSISQDPDRALHLRAEALAWMRQVYIPSCDAVWRRIVCELIETHSNG